MYSVASIASASLSRPGASSPGLQAVCFAPGQGAAVLRTLRWRQDQEQGPGLAPQDDALANSATTVAVIHRGDVVAALGLHTAGSPALLEGLGPLLALERFSASWPEPSMVTGSGLAVLGEYRTGAVMDLLLCHAYRHARDLGARFALISCSPALHALFSLYGFREYLPPAILPGDIATLRMALVLEHLPDLQASDSPLLELVRQPELGASAHAWLAQAFPMLG